MVSPEKLQRDISLPGVAVLTMNRPEVMNAIDMELFELLSAALEELENDDAIRAIVVTGAGGRAFSAGFDIREMADFDAATMAAAFARRDPLFWRIASHRKPVLAALNGVAYGAGALMAVAADLRIGGFGARLKITASTYGGANATWSLPRIVGVAKAKDILFTGRTVDAREAQSIGLIDRLVADEEVLAAAVELAAMIASNPSDGVQAVKALIDAGLGRTLEAAYQAERDWMVAKFETRPTSGAGLFGGFMAKRRDGTE